MVWKIAVDLEVTSGKLRIAKSLLYRALSECPYSKRKFIFRTLYSFDVLPGLYMMAFTQPLRSEFTNSELEVLVNTMMERGIRIREDVESYVEEARRGEVSDDQESDTDMGDVNELEIVASEQRRLAPY